MPHLVGGATGVTLCHCREKGPGQIFISIGGGGGGGSLDLDFGNGHCVRMRQGVWSERI